jgi:hypothetical protein
MIPSRGSEYLHVLRMRSVSRSARPAAAQAMASDCGEMSEVSFCVGGPEGPSLIAYPPPGCSVNQDLAQAAVRVSSPDPDLGCSVALRKPSGAVQFKRIGAEKEIPIRRL